MADMVGLLAAGVEEERAGQKLGMQQLQQRRKGVGTAISMGCQWDTEHSCVVVLLGVTLRGKSDGDMDLGVWEGGMGDVTWMLEGMAMYYELFEKKF
jgi:hypothetical protein